MMNLFGTMVVFAATAVQLASAALLVGKARPEPARARLNSRVGGTHLGGVSWLGWSHETRRDVLSTNTRAAAMLSKGPGGYGMCLAPGPYPIRHCRLTESSGVATYLRAWCPGTCAPAPCEASGIDASSLTDLELDNRGRCYGIWWTIQLQVCYSLSDIVLAPPSVTVCFFFFGHTSLDAGRSHLNVSHGHSTSFSTRVNLQPPYACAPLVTT